MKNLALITLLFATLLFGSCNNMLLDLAYKQIDGEWVRSDSDALGIVLTVSFNIKERTFKWTDMLEDQERYSKDGHFELYTNSKVDDSTKQATLVLCFNKSEENEEEQRESFYIFFTEKEDGSIYLNMSQQTNTSKAYLFRKN